MILHAGVMLGALGGLVAAGGLALAGAPWRPVVLGAGAGLVVLTLERALAGIRASVRFRDLAGLAFAPVHLGRDLCWAAAIVVWTLRRLGGQSPRPAHSMGTNQE
jgi:hypothetical protein